MASFFRRHLNLLLGILISAVAVYFSLKRVDFHLLWESFLSANYLYLIPAVILQFFCFFFKGAGWRFLLLPAARQQPVP